LAAVVDLGRASTEIAVGRQRVGGLREGVLSIAVERAAA
jgi:hypothetical protein